MNQYTIGLPNIKNVGEYYYGQSNPLIRLWGCSFSIGHTNIGISFLYIENFNNAYTTLSVFWLAVRHSVKSTAS